MSAKPLYTDELGERIVDLMCEPLSIAKISLLEGMPSKQTIIKWGNDKEHPFYPLYQSAFEIRADVLADQCIDIADDSGTLDFGDLTYDNQGNPKLNREFIERSKLKCQERHWAAGVYNRKKYGDKVSAEITGEGGAPLIPTSIIFEIDED